MFKQPMDNQNVCGSMLVIQVAARTTVPLDLQASTSRVNKSYVCYSSIGKPITRGFDNHRWGKIKLCCRLTYHRR